MKKEAWIVTVDEEFYYKEFHRDCYGGGWEFTPYIDQACHFPTAAAAKGILLAVTSGGDFKDTRGYVTPTTAFGMRKLTRKDYNTIKKRQDAKTFFRKKEQGVAA